MDNAAEDARPGGPLRGAWLYRNYGKNMGAASAIAGILGRKVYKSSIAINVAKDLGRADGVAEGIKRMRSIGVRLVSHFYGVALWLSRDGLGLVYMQRAFSFSTLGITATIQASKDEFYEQKTDNHDATKEVLVDLELMDERGQDGRLVKEVGNTDAGTFLLVCMFAAFARERELRKKAERGTPLTPEEEAEKVDWRGLFCAFCFWGDFILRAIEQGIIRFDYTLAQPIFVDQKRLTELRFRMHFSLNEFEGTFKVFACESAARGRRYELVQFTPPTGSPAAIEAALAAEQAAEDAAAEFGAAPEED